MLMPIFLEPDLKAKYQQTMDRERKLIKEIFEDEANQTK